MSVDTFLRLPPNVRVNDATKVIGRLLGRTGRKELLLPTTDYVARVDDVDVSPSHIAKCANVDIGDEHFLWHFESEGGRRLILFRSTARNIALANALADFFGGLVVYQDGGALSIADYAVPDKGDDMNHPDDGDPWTNLQDRILTLQPLSRENIEACRAFAAYPEI